MDGRFEKYAGLEEIIFPDFDDEDYKTMKAGLEYLDLTDVSIKALQSMCGNREIITRLPSGLHTQVEWMCQHEDFEKAGETPFTIISTRTSMQQFFNWFARYASGHLHTQWVWPGKWTPHTFVKPYDFANDLINLTYLTRFGEKVQAHLVNDYMFSREPRDRYEKAIEIIFPSVGYKESYLEAQGVKTED